MRIIPTADNLDAQRTQMDADDAIRRILDDQGLLRLHQGRENDNLERGQERTPAQTHKGYGDDPVEAVRNRSLPPRLGRKTRKQIETPPMQEHGRGNVAV